MLVYKGTERHGLPCLTQSIDGSRIAKSLHYRDKRHPGAEQYDH